MHPRRKQLSARLSACLAQLPDGVGRLIDVGTDHAHLPLAAIWRGVCRSVLAIDCHDGPVRRARKNVARAGLEQRIEVRQGFGLDGVVLRPDDAVIIAGMGGREMCDILGATSGHSIPLILQPNWTQPELRIWLAAQGFAGFEEHYVRERQRIYLLIQARWQNKTATLSRLESELGVALIERLSAGQALNSLQFAYLQQRLAYLRQRAQGDKSLIFDLATLTELVAAQPRASHPFGERLR